jgi:hypothetical protein
MRTAPVTAEETEMSTKDKLAANKKIAAEKRAAFQKSVAKGKKSEPEEKPRKRDRVKAFVKESVKPTAENVAVMQKKVVEAKSEGGQKMRKRDKVKNFFQRVFKKKQDFLEFKPYYDKKTMPDNTYKPKSPFEGKIVSVERIVGAEATGETCNIVIDHGGKMPYIKVSRTESSPQASTPKMANQTRSAFTQLLRQDMVTT